VKGLYRGLSAPLVGAAAENAGTCAPPSLPFRFGRDSPSLTLPALPVGFGVKTVLFYVYNQAQSLIRAAAAGEGGMGKTVDSVTGKETDPPLTIPQLALAASAAGAAASFVL